MILKKANVLIVDDDPDVLTAVKLLLKTEAQEVITEKNPENINWLLQRNQVDLVLLDMNYNSAINTGNEGIYWLRKVKEWKPDVCVIMITAYGDIDLAVRSLKEGANDFVVKPWHNEKLLETIKDLLEKKGSIKTARSSAKSTTGSTEILGESDAMEDVFHKVNKIAPTDANILILGENGTGKDLMAKAIHERSMRANKPFVKVDVGALTDTLFESELFGHKKGAFTDAREDRPGRFEDAHGGTLFLDEIGNITLQQQAKLLTVLQNRQVTRLGTNKPIDIDIRLICATNVPLQELANENKFRKDLIYRINTVEITMPPLRRRNNDIVLLAKHFARIYASKYAKPALDLDNSAINKLRTYNFPGNVRELQYSIERAVIMADGHTLTSDDLIFSSLETAVEPVEMENVPLSTMEKSAILRVIDKHNGNITRAAKELGLTRTALYRRLSSMIYDRYEWRLILRVIAIFVTITVAAFIVVKGTFIYLVFMAPLIAYQLTDLIRLQKKAQDEVSQFVESIQYRDFSRHFDERHAPSELKPLRKGFNDINTTFKLISRERETQYHYLQKILELVDTGIVSYDAETGETGWINEAFKNLLTIPYLKTIHSLEKREPGLYHDVIALKPGDSKVVTLTRNQQLIKILVTASVIRSDGRLSKLLAFQNVSEALDETESKAWQKLLNVMTHEIMNSVAPISSLADTLKNRLQSPEIANSPVSSELEDLELGIDTIKRRSEGLLKFTESYRNLNKITKLDLKKIMVRDLFENLSNLMAPTLDKKNIELDIVLRDPTLAVEADINLVEQVLINLLVNAIEAVKDREEPLIVLSAEVQANNKIIVKIADNGIGMPAELLDKIFIPFFSTRKTGSGIGLSLCKQIMLLHKGNIQVQSTEGKGSAFLLQFVP